MDQQHQHKQQQLRLAVVSMPRFLVSLSLLLFLHGVVVLVVEGFSPAPTIRVRNYIRPTKSNRVLKNRLISQRWAEPEETTKAAAAVVDATDNEKKKKRRNVQVGDLLSDLPTPSLLLELSQMEKFLLEQQHHHHESDGLDEFLKRPSDWTSAATSRDALQESGSLFIHTSVVSTEKRDAVVKEKGSGKSLSICTVDTPIEWVEPAGGAYLGLGLANHHVIGYYWARSMGIGASLPAHGIYFGPLSHSESEGDDDYRNGGGGELYWKKRGPGSDPGETTEESSNSNDGKRSEWADFLKAGDTVQLVPNDPLSILVAAAEKEENDTDYCFDVLIGIRRAGRPLGADPIVEKIWKRSEGGKDISSVWVSMQD